MCLCLMEKHTISTQPNKDGRPQYGGAELLNSKQNSSIGKAPQGVVATLFIENPLSMSSSHHAGDATNVDSAAKQVKFEVPTRCGLICRFGLSKLCAGQPWVYNHGYILVAMGRQQGLLKPRTSILSVKCHVAGSTAVS